MSLLPLRCQPESAGLEKGLIEFGPMTHNSWFSSVYRFRSKPSPTAVFNVGRLSFLNWPIKNTVMPGSFPGGWLYSMRQVIESRCHSSAKRKKAICSEKCYWITSIEAGHVRGDVSHNAVVCQRQVVTFCIDYVTKTLKINIVSWKRSSKKIKAVAWRHSTRLAALYLWWNWFKYASCYAFNVRQKEMVI